MTASARLCCGDAGGVVRHICQSQKLLSNQHCVCDGGCIHQVLVCICTRQSSNQLLSPQAVFSAAFFAKLRQEGINTFQAHEELEKWLRQRIEPLQCKRKVGGWRLKTLHAGPGIFSRGSCISPSSQAHVQGSPHLLSNVQAGPHTSHSSKSKILVECFSCGAHDHS